MTDELPKAIFARLHCKDCILCFMMVKDAEIGGDKVEKYVMVHELVIGFN